MKNIPIKIIAFVMLTMLGIKIQAQETGENRNLFKTAGEKQTEKGFIPAPDEIVKINQCQINY